MNEKQSKATDQIRDHVNRAHDAILDFRRVGEGKGDGAGLASAQRGTHGLALSLILAGVLFSIEPNPPMISMRSYPC
jgi:hypothetical protein